MHWRHCDKSFQPRLVWFQLTCCTVWPLQTIGTCRLAPRSLGGLSIWTIAIVCEGFRLVQREPRRAAVDTMTWDFQDKKSSRIWPPTEVPLGSTSARPTLNCECQAWRQWGPFSQSLGWPGTTYQPLKWGVIALTQVVSYCWPPVSTCALNSCHCVLLNLSYVWKYWHKSSWSWYNHVQCVCVFFLITLLWLYF